jgi:hypothetical protein
MGFRMTDWTAEVFDCSLHGIKSADWWLEDQSLLSQGVPIRTEAG